MDGVKLKGLSQDDIRLETSYGFQDVLVWRFSLKWRNADYFLPIKLNF
jgi:hypothetical protein